MITQANLMHGSSMEQTRRLRHFPVGYHAIHPNVSLNFQMNRWYSWTNDEGMLDEMRTAAPLINSYADVKHIFTELSRKAMAENQILRAAFYLRMAEFFMYADDPDKLPARNRFVKLLVDHYQILDRDKYLIPFQNGNLVAYRLTPEHPKSTLVVFGGFDSYIEEFFPILLSFRDAGYDIVCFEGPGQGAVLEDYHIVMTPEWEIPVKTILDYFKLDGVTLIGISFGGYLALRAAAYEPRVRHVVCWDVIGDFFECTLGLVAPMARNLLRVLITGRASGIANLLLERAIKSSLVLEWAAKQGMHVFGAKTPYETLRNVARCHTRDISPLVHQDVLVLAGKEDHYVPIHLFYDQIRALKNVHSLTARLFTREEQAQNHCQVGNIGLVIDVILNWIENVHGSVS